MRDHRYLIKMVEGGNDAYLALDPERGLCTTRHRDRALKYLYRNDARARARHVKAKGRIVRTNKVYTSPRTIVHGYVGDKNL